jgi:hypothetical protein
VATNITELKIILFLNRYRKNFSQWTKNYSTFYSKLSKIWVADPRSGKNIIRIPDTGVKKAPDPGSGFATLLKPGHVII